MDRPILPLTPRLRQAKTFIEDYMRNSGGVSPSVKDVAEAFDLSMGGADGLLRGLVKRGHARRTPGHHRSLELIKPDKAQAA